VTKDYNNVDLDEIVEIDVFHHFMPRGKVEERNTVNARRKLREKLLFIYVFIYLFFVKEI